MISLDRYALYFTTSTPNACGKETNSLAWNLVTLFLGHPQFALALAVIETGGCKQ